MHSPGRTEPEINTGIGIEKAEKWDDTLYANDDSFWAEIDYQLDLKVNPTFRRVLAQSDPIVIESSIQQFDWSRLHALLKITRLTNLADCVAGHT